jgi:hypothetical protein
MATGPAAFTIARTCPAPKPSGARCNRLLEAPHTLCDAHRGADRHRQCAAPLGTNGTTTQCQAWPEPGLPYCDAHDPTARELRRQERLSARARIAAVQKAVNGAPPLVRVKLLELLVAEGHVTVAAVDDVLRRYLVIG